MLPGRELPTHRPLWGSLVSIIFTSNYVSAFLLIGKVWKTWAARVISKSTKCLICVETLPGVTARRKERTFAEPPSSLPLIREELARAPSCLSPAPEGQTLQDWAPSYSTGQRHSRCTEVPPEILSSIRRRGWSSHTWQFR